MFQKGWTGVDSGTSYLKRRAVEGRGVGVESQARGRAQARTSGKNKAGVLSGPGTQWPWGEWHKGRWEQLVRRITQDLVSLV